MLLGHTCVCAVEWDKHARQCLLARQRDGCLPRFPIWDDVQTFDGKPWRGRVDVVCGGFPCQDISAAGKGAGIDGARSGMWHHMARIVGEIRPRFVFVENSPMLTIRGLGRVLGDLDSMGYHAAWGVLGAADIGAPHKRDRIWIVADRGQDGREHEADAKQSGGDPARRTAWAWRRVSQSSGLCCGRLDADGDQWGNDPCETKPRMVRMVDGVAYQVDRLERIGNGQVPAVAALAFQVLSARLDSDLANAQDQRDAKRLR